MRYAMKTRWPLILAMLIVPSLTTPARAGDALTIVATSVAHTKPTQVELTASVSGEAELAKDALVKYRDAKRRAIEAIGKLDIKDLTIKELGVSARVQANQQAMMAMMQGNPNPNLKPNYQFREQLRLTVKGIDKLDSAQVAELLAKVVDASRDAGLTIGPQGPSNIMEAQMMQRGAGSSSIATFRLPDATAAKAQAYETAVKDAKARAQKLADATGVKLGAVTSVQEIPAGQAAATDNEDDSSKAMLFAMYGWQAALMQNNDKRSATAEPTSDTYEEVAVPVTLVVQFAVSK